MQIDKAEIIARELIRESDAAYLTTIAPDGFPATRGMLNLHSPERYPLLKEYLGERAAWELLFTTNTSSQKMSHLRENPKVSVYYCRPQLWSGLLLCGTMEIVTDMSVKEALWQPDWTAYYPGGAGDEDYAVLRLIPQRAELYHQLDGAKWEI